MTTTQIYKGSIAFIVLQLIMVAIVIAFPSLVASGTDTKAKKIDVDKALEMMSPDRGRGDAPAADPFAVPPRERKDEDPMELFKQQPPAR